VDFISSLAQNMEGYSRNVSCVLTLISTFLVINSFPSQAIHSWFNKYCMQFCPPLLIYLIIHVCLPLCCRLMGINVNYTARMDLLREMWISSAPLHKIWSNCEDRWRLCQLIRTYGEKWNMAENLDNIRGYRSVGTFSWFFAPKHF
jgi:hypothetical protein